MRAFKDGEVVGISYKGHLMQWDDGLKQIYSSRQTPEIFGVQNLTEQEWSRLPADVQALRAY
jgi:hypothetical protein